MEYGFDVFGKHSWGSDIEKSELTFSELVDLEKAQFRKPYIKFLFAWGGNWARARDSAGSILASITSSSEDASGDYPDDRVIDGIRPHKDPTDSSWNGYWKASSSSVPQWLKIDLGVSRTVNRIILYHYYDSDHCLEDFKIQSSTDDVTYIDRKKILNNTDTKTVIDFDTDITARYWKLYITKVANSNIAKVQEIEFYNYQDESLRVKANNGVPNYTIAIKAAKEQNALPEPTSFSVVLNNEDNKFSPYNESSNIYGTKQLDGIGYIRGGTPVLIKGGFYNSDDIFGSVELLSGQIGNDDNPAASDGISLNTNNRTVTISGKDFSNKLKTTDVPKGLQVYENKDIDYLIRELGYIANIPYQDMDIEATGITITYDIIREGNIADAMDKLRESINGKLYTSYDEKLKFITTIPYRHWTQSEKSEFDAGVKTNVDTATVPGQVTLEKVEGDLMQQTIHNSLYFNYLNHYQAQSFVYSYDIVINSISLYVGNAAGTIVRVETDNGNKPSGVLVHANAATTGGGSSDGWYTFTFSNFKLLRNTKYWIVVQMPKSPASKGRVFYNSAGGFADGQLAYTTDGGSTWNTTAYDITFKINAYYYKSSGSLISQEHDLTVNIQEWGVFSADYDDDITFKTFTYATPGTAWNEANAVEAINGEKIQSTIQRYIKWKAYFATSDIATTPVLRSVTINWITTTGVTRNYVFQCDFTGDNRRIESINYQIGNPKINYAKIRVNPYILQSLATVWEYDELPIALANGESITINAFYTYPSIRNSGGNIRKANLTISGSNGTCNDGSTATINGCDISFNSGANIGTITITNNSGGARSVTVLSIDATELHDAETEGRKTQVEASDTTSIDFYGGKKFIKTIDNMFIPTKQIAQDLADNLVDYDKYYRGYASNVKVPLIVNLTLQDIISITHPHIPVSGKQLIPSAITHRGFVTSIKAIES